MEVRVSRSILPVDSVIEGSPSVTEPSDIGGSNVISEEDEPLVASVLPDVIDVEDVMDDEDEDVL